MFVTRAFVDTVIILFIMSPAVVGVVSARHNHWRSLLLMIGIDDVVYYQKRRVHNVVLTGEMIER